MTDRDDHRRGDPLHRPFPIAGTLRDRRDATPVEHRRVVPVELTDLPPSVEVDADAFTPDVRWREFDEMRAAVHRCEKNEADRARWRRWLLASTVPSGAGIISLLVWAVTKLDARAEANAEERVRRAQIQRHETEIRALQLQSAGIQAVLGLRAMTAPNP